jgi:MSHA biogenesis protein MshI
MLNWGIFKKHTAVVGIEMQADGLAVVAQRWSDGVPAVVQMDFLPCRDASFAQATLKNWVKQHQLSQSPCYVALGGEQYQMLLVEPPDVPEAEWRSAIRWRMKDLISIPLAQAAIEVFALPEDGTRSNKKMVYVVAAHEQQVRDTITLVAQAGLKLMAIDIGELTIRNLANRLICDDNSQRGIAVARIRRGGGSVYIYKHGNMYLARSFVLDYQGGELDDLPAVNLALELQRSIDYYERQMGQAPPTVIYLCGENIRENKLTAELKANIAVQLQVLDPAAVMLMNDASLAPVAQRCIGALGAALRMEQAT